MKKFLKDNKLGKKNTILSVVALFLIMITVVGVSFSWIEDVSHVEFSSTDGQQTPLHVGEKTLKSDAIINSSSNTSSIDLQDYFYKSGDMHLSPCYGDGNDFYFPVEKKTAGSTAYRTGTKDDANVNYLSATFRVRSEDAGCAFWFEKTGNTDYVKFKKGDANSANNSVLQKLLRISVTVDGATNVYALNTTGKFNTIESGTRTEKTGRRVDQYTYYTESYTNKLPNTSTNSSKANQGASGHDLNGNTVFTVPKYDDQNKASTVKTVTVKLWLECKSSTLGSNTASVDVSDININLVSSWAKTRRIYVLDRTESEVDHNSNGKWLFDSSAKVYWKTKDLSKSKQLLSSSSNYASVTIDGTTYKSYFLEFPAVYNNAEVVLFRCNSSGGGNSTYTSGNNTQNYWDKWETSFPDSYHSETFSLYTSSFGTWEDYANKVYFLNTCNTSEGFDNRTPRAYMWDSKSVIDASNVDKKVVQNALWTGQPMTKTQTQTTVASHNFVFDVYTFYYNAIYDRIIFNDDFGERLGQNQYQTQDLWLTDISAQGQMNKPYFDMATLTWYSNLSSIPKFSNVFLKSTIRGSSTNWAETRFAISSSNSNEKYCYFYIRSNKTAGNNNTYDFCINDLDANVVWKCHKDSGWLAVGTEYECKNEADFNKNFTVSFDKKGVYLAKFNTSTHKFKIELSEDLSGS